MLGEHLVHVPLDDGRFTDAEVSDHQHFEQALALHFCCCCSSGGWHEVSNYGLGMKREGFAIGTVGLKSCKEAEIPSCTCNI